MKIVLPRGFLFVFCLASLVLAAKLALSYNTYGTNDITYTIHFAQAIEKYGTFRVYSLVPIYNHPPLVSWLLRAVTWVSGLTGLSFAFVYRLMAILSDYGSVFVVWGLLRNAVNSRRVLISCLVALNPINLLVSGFHGNTDPVFVFLLLAAIYAAERKRVAFSGFLYGLSMCIKIVPVLLAPVFLFYFLRRQGKARFAVFAAATPICLFAPYLFYDFSSLAKNVFMHGGLAGIWGLGRILRDIALAQWLPLAIRQVSWGALHIFVAWGRILLALGIFAFSWFVVCRKKAGLSRGAFAVFCLFLVITPGFGVQYLSWLSSFAILVMPGWGAVYGLLGGFFLYRVYSYWGGAVAPLFYANSDKVGQWVGFERVLDLALWIFVALMLFAFWRRLRRGRLL